MDSFLSDILTPQWLPPFPLWNRPTGQSLGKVPFVAKLLYSTSKEPACLYGFNSNSWYMLYSLALEQKVDALLYKQLCRHKALFSTIPSSIRRAFRAIYTYNYNQNLYGINEANQIAQAFYTVGIPICAKRGITLLNDVYTDLGVRPLEDIDFIVSSQNISTADQLLQGLGYEISRINDQFYAHLSNNVDINSILYKKKGNYQDYDRKLTVDISFHSRQIDLQSIIDNSVQPTNQIQWRALRAEDNFLLLCQGLYDSALERSTKPGVEHCNIGKLIDLTGYMRNHSASISSRFRKIEIVSYACTCAASLWNITLFDKEV